MRSTHGFSIGSKACNNKDVIARGRARVGEIPLNSDRRQETTDRVARRLSDSPSPFPAELVVNAAASQRFRYTPVSPRFSATLVENLFKLPARHVGKRAHLVRGSQRLHFAEIRRAQLIQPCDAQQRHGCGDLVFQ
jgi:hypothetical protein